MKRNGLSKVIAAFMALVMTLAVFTVLPSIRFSSVMAEGSDEFPEIHYRTEDGTQVALGKDAYLTEDGTYTIDLSAYTVGSPVIKERTVKVPTDYVLVIDASNSMKDTYSCQLHGDQHVWHCYHISATRAAASAFIDELRADSTTFENPEWNLDSRVAVVTYATADGTSQGTGYYYNGTGIYKATGSDNASFYKYARNTADAADIPLASSIYDDAFMSVLDDYEAAQNAIDAIELNPYTAMHLGMEMAEGIIEATAARTTDSQDDHYNKYYDQDSGEWKVRPKVVVLFTDGVSGNIGYSNKSVAESIEHANQIKATGAKIYTVGLVSTTMFTQHGDCWQDQFGKGEVTGAYGGPHKGIGEFQVNNYAFEEFTNSEPTPLKNRQKEYFAGFEKLKTDLGLTSDEEALEKYIELQKNQYRIMGLTRGFLYKDVLMAISSEYDYVNVSFVNEKDAVNNNGKTCDWLLYDHDGKFIQWYSSAPVVDLKDANGDRIGARYGQTMTNVLKGDSSLGETYPSTNAIWKKMYQTTTENLLTLDPSDNTYKYMDVEVPVVTQEAGYVGGERVGYEYAKNADLRFYIPITNAYDMVGGSGQDNIQILIDAFKQIQEFSVSEYLGTNANTGLENLSAITDKISENFIIPEDFSAENNISAWIAPVDDAAMKADSQTNGTSINKWLFEAPSEELTAVEEIAPNISDARLTRRLYGDDADKLDGAVRFDKGSRTITYIGFRWEEGGWYCSYNPEDDVYTGHKLIIRISGLTAKDDVVPNSSIPTNDKMYSGMVQYWRDTHVATLETVNGNERLLFPEPTVKIRQRLIVYDYGFRLADNDLPGFFADEGETDDVEQLLSIDYMYNSQRKNGALNYHESYPYDGAKGRDIYGNPITYGTDIAHDEDGFEIGFDNGVGYFEPHTISHRDYQVAALLKLSGTQKDVFGNSLNKYEWCKLIALPATNVLYEAEQGVTASNLEGSFVTYESSNFASSGSWSIEGSFDANATQQHYNKLYGYDPVYNGKLDCDANGASMKVTVNSALYDAVKAKTATWPVAKFSFRGSGFSFTTRCGLDTGIFILDIVPHGQDQKYNNTSNHPASGGYSPVDGDNYHTIVNTRYYGGSTEPDGSALLHQIPVFRRGHMPYQDYDVYLTPVYFPNWAEDPTQSVSTKSGEEVSMRLDKIIPGIGDIEYTITNAVENGEGEATRAKLESFTSYIDTVRIYHPLGAKVHAKDTDAVEYYHAHEMNAKYVETRALLINSIQNLSQGGNGGNIDGAIFLDYGPASEGGDQHFNANDPTTYAISDYVKFGPNNEMYLKGMTSGSDKGGSFTFALANPGKVTNLHLSMKAHESDQPAQVTITLLLNNPRTKTIEVNSTTEMYYDLLSGFSSYDLNNLRGINIACTGNVTLSIVNLKIVYKDGYVETSETGSVNANVVTNLETVEFANAIAFGVKGDANGDNTTDMSDALLIMRKAIDSEIEFGISASYLSDVNADGAIDLADALSTMRLALN